MSAALALSFVDAAGHAASSSQIWRAEDLSHADGTVQASGHPALDAELPGGGWPVGALTEILHAEAAACTWQILLPALAQAVALRGGPVVLIGAPHAPFAPALAAQGLPAASLLWVRGNAQPARFWATEQALRCADVAAVLAWLPQARSADLRRLQLAAAQHESLLWVFRPVSAAQTASPARLRLEVAADDATSGQLQVHIIKRRGPPLLRPIRMPARSERLDALLAAQRSQRDQSDQREESLQRRRDEKLRDVVRLISAPSATLPLVLSIQRPYDAAVVPFSRGRVGHAMDRHSLAS